MPPASENGKKLKHEEDVSTPPPFLCVPLVCTDRQDHRHSMGHLNPSYNIDFEREYAASANAYNTLGAMGIPGAPQASAGGRIATSLRWLSGL